MVQDSFAAGRRGTALPTRRQILTSAGLGTLALATPALATPALARADRPTLSFWQFYAPGGPVAAQAQWFEDVVAKWNASNDVKVTLEYVPNDQYMNGSKLQTAFASGSGPDLFLISPGDFLRYGNARMLLDLTPYIDAAAQRDFPEQVMATRKIAGRIYGIPMEVEPMAMYYSLAAFEKAGLGEADIPKDWDALLALGKKLTTHNRFGLLFETTPGYYQNFTWYPFLWQGGGGIQKDGKSSFNGAAAVQALQLWQESVASGAAPRKLLGGGAWDIVPNLASGYCAMQNCGIWGISALRSNAPSFRYGVFPLPVPKGGRPVTVGGGWAFVANARGRDPETAGRFCAWALASTKPDSVQRVADWCTRAKSDMPPRTSVFAAASAAYGSGLLKLFKDEIYPTVRGEPRVPPQVYKIISDAIQECQLGGRSPEQQAASASQQIDDYLATYSGAPII